MKTRPRTVAGWESPRRPTSRAELRSVGAPRLVLRVEERRLR